MKKILITLPLLLLFIAGCADRSDLPDLPTPEFAEGFRGYALEIDKNINEATIDQFLHRPDSVYRDMRLLIDPADFENIDGDSYLSGFVEGFEVIPLPYLVTINLPEAVGTGYRGPTLFTLTDDGEYIANFEESMRILEWFFPKDKNIFLMCGGGGYSRDTRRMLIALGWDGNKIFNTGGHWHYEGDYNVSVRNKDGDEVTYDFWKITYHHIDFSRLREVNE